jgi:hypothetical protein
MERQCAWCGRGLGRVPPLDDDRVSHGICAACEAAHFPGLRTGGVPAGPRGRPVCPTDSPRPHPAPAGD